MIPRLENALLATNLDCNDFVLRNVALLLPVPPPLLDAGDQRLNDQRVPPEGSVTNESVSPVADIAQSKLNLNGNLPSGWLGASSKQAAQGDLVERVANKNAPNGYPGIDVNGRVASSVISTGAAAGTVNLVGLHMPTVFGLQSVPVIDSGQLTQGWGLVDNNTYFGVMGGTPSFLPSPIPAALLPGIDASKFTTGNVLPSMLPLATGMGSGHAAGAIPDPGLDGSPNNYLGRDMTWRPFVLILAYQPFATPPEIKVGIGVGTSFSNVVIRSKLAGSNLFYRVNGGAFIEVVPADPNDIKISLSLASGDFVEAYAARDGYNNSTISNLKLP
jgi:hypothetical protein